MNDPRPVKQVINEVLLELSRLNYSESTIKTYAFCYKRLVKFMDLRGILFYEEQVCLDYLQWRYDIMLTSLYEQMSRKVRTEVGLLGVLWNYQTYGSVFPIVLLKQPFRSPIQFSAVYEAFLDFSDLKKTSQATMKSMLPVVQKLLMFLNDKKVQDIEQLTSKHLTEFCSTFIGHSPRYLAGVVIWTKKFLKFLYQEGYINHELSQDLPKVRYARNGILPYSWKKEEVFTVLSAIDRGNPGGKRDYAILLLITRLGLRAGDVKNLKLNQIDWNRKKLTIIQQKTKQLLELPLLDDVGWAIIDYLQHGRPERTQAETVFVKQKAPYGPFDSPTSMQSVLMRYIRKSQLNLPKDMHCNLHSLRSTLARIMLENETSLPVISEVLGHESIQTTSIYLKIDLEGLRRCPIDPEEVFRYEN